MVGPGRTVDAYWTNGWSGTWYTDAFITASREGANHATLARNVRVKDIGSDAFQNVRLLVNCIVDGIDKSGTSFHADVVQFHSNSGVVENRILYGLEAISNIGAQGLFAGADISLKDIAFVNCNVRNGAGGPADLRRVFQFGGPTEHMFIQNSQFVGPSAWRTDFSFTAKNVIIEDTTFSDPLPVLEGVEYR
jgi:hypothetical protein